MKTNHLFKFKSSILLMSTLTILLVGSCEREEDVSIQHQKAISEKFFNYRGNVNLTKEIINYLVIKNDTAQFTQLFVDKYGFPIWEKAVNVYEDNYSTLFVPFTIDYLTKLRQFGCLKL